MYRRLIFVLLLLGSVWLDARAQFSSVRGRVADAVSDSVLAGANIRLASDDEGMRGTASDAAGRFFLSGIRPGNYVVTATHVGYAPHAETLEVEFGRDVSVEIRLRPSREPLDELVVESPRLPDVASLGAGQIQIRPMALQRVPIPDVSSDLMAFLTTRPGVVTAGDRGGQLFVRGGTPSQNLILLDGMRLFQPFHVVGFYSVFPADLVAEADFFAGGFSARYGGRISSVLDVKTRSGSKRAVKGGLSIAPFLASINAEIPFVPEKVSIIASARESVIERIAPRLLGERLPYRFGDRFLKLHAYLNRTSSFSATLLHSFDEGDIAGLEDRDNVSKWRNTAVGGRYTYLPPEYPLMTELAVYGTVYSSSFLPAAGLLRTSDVSAVNSDIRFAYLLGPLQLHFGLATATSSMTYDLGSAHLEQKESVTEGGVYLSVDWKASPTLHFEPGFRFQSYSSGIGSSLEPRFRMAWMPGGRRTISAAWGIYHQQILGLNNQRDVTDAFIAWVPVPNHSPLPRSMHLILGWREEFGRSVEAGVEGYYRDLDNILFPLTGDGVGSASELDRVNGSARGVEFTLDLTRPSLYLHAGYSLSAVDYAHVAARSVVRPAPEGGLMTVRLTERSHFRPPHDRRHQLNLQARYSSGPYSASVRWHFGSGLPYTPIHGYYESAPPASPDDQEFLRKPGSVEVAFAEPYSHRLPAYHRLDVSAERDFTFTGWRLIIQAGVINLYDRENIFSYDLLLGRRVNQLPLIPSLGIRVEVI